jgi:hypothetical protein
VRNIIIPVAAAAALTASPAHAGKLAAGFRGVPFGPATVLDAQPLPDCAAEPENGVRWQCNTTIAGAAVQVNYMVDEGLFFAVLMQAQGAQTLAQLEAALVAAWGQGQDGGYRMDRFWQDGNTVASISHNSYSYSITVLLQDRAVSKQVEASKALRAAKAVDDL